VDGIFISYILDPHLEKIYRSWST